MIYLNINLDNLKSFVNFMLIRFSVLILSYWEDFITNTKARSVFICVILFKTEIKISDIHKDAEDWSRKFKGKSRTFLLSFPSLVSWMKTLRTGGLLEWNEQPYRSVTTYHSL